MYTWNRCGIVPIHQLIHWLPWALRYTPPKAAGHSGQTDCASPKRRGATQGRRAPIRQSRPDAGDAQALSLSRGGGNPSPCGANPVGIFATHRRRAPIRQSRPDAGDARPSSFPRRRESIRVVPMLPSSFDTLSSSALHPPGTRRPHNPFAPSSGDASAARIEGRARISANVLPRLGPLSMASPVHLLCQCSQPRVVALSQRTFLRTTPFLDLGLRLQRLDTVGKLLRPHPLDRQPG